MRDKNKKRLYIITEATRRRFEQYTMYGTEAEIKAWCKMKNDFYGGSRADGGDPSYSCWAMWATY